MTSALIRKELRDQRAFVGLGVFLCVAETLEMLLLELPDQRPLWINWTRELVSEGNAILMLHVEDDEVASNILKQNGFRLLTQREISR